MARWRHEPAPGGTVLHADHGRSVHVLGLRPAAAPGRAAGFMGSVGDCYDNSLMESLFGTL